jgi:hypothetical protein
MRPEQAFDTLRPVRFSIAGLMAAVFILAVGFAGLRTASSLWASAVFTSAITLFAIAMLAAAACRGASRMTWLGFGVFGWTYLLATFWLWPAPNGVSAPPLLTKAVLDYFQPSSNNSTVMWIDTAPAGEMSTDRAMTAPFAGRVVNRFHYRRIGHTLAAIAFGLFGALLGTVLAARRQSADGQRPSRTAEARR